ncbi:DUF4111 domain-containing protein [Flindersiella endophytica]
MTDPRALRIAEHYLRVADRMLPGRITAFYLVGSTALGAFRYGHSDLDFVAVVDGLLSTDELRRLRVAHLAANLPQAVRAIGRGQFALPGTANGMYVSKDDLTTPVTRIRPLAAHNGARFFVGRGGDLNPVQWKVLAERGVALRGPDAGDLGLDPEPSRLREWNLDNLRSYWQPWADRVLAGELAPRWPMPKRWLAAWGVLGAPRLHCTIATGEVVSKEAAGEYALEMFEPRWHPIVRDGLSYLRDEPVDARFTDRGAASREAAAFVLHVAADAERLPE